MSSRRNYFIRTVASVTGDLAAGLALAAACTWVIQVAVLGVFLSFLLWLLGLIAWLALSQYTIHPVIAALLSDRKLDQGLAISAEALSTTAFLATALWDSLLQHSMDPRAIFKKA